MPITTLQHIARLLINENWAFSFSKELLLVRHAPLITDCFERATYNEETKELRIFNYEGKEIPVKDVRHYFTCKKVGWNVTS